MERGPWKLKEKLSHCQIWEHTRLFLLAEAYLVLNYQHTHARINRNKPHLVNSIGGFTDDRTGQSFLLVEPIQARLSKFFTLTESDIFIILDAVLRGLAELEQTYGYVGLSEDCVCFTQNGSVKVWVNPDLSSIHPISLIQERGFKTIVQIIAKFIVILENKCPNSQMLHTFMKNMSNHNVYSYTQAAQQLLAIGKSFGFSIKLLSIFHKSTNYCLNKSIQNSLNLFYNRSNNSLHENKNAKKKQPANHRRNMSVNERIISHKHQISHEQINKKPTKKHYKSNSELSPFQQIHLHKSGDAKGKFWFENKIQNQKVKENQNRSFSPYSSIDQLSRRMKTINSSKDIEVEEQLIKQKVVDIKTSFCPQEPCLITEIQGEFKTFGLLDEEIEKKRKTKNDQCLLKCKNKQFNEGLLQKQTQVQKIPFTKTKSSSLTKQDHRGTTNIFNNLFLSKSPHSLTHSNLSFQLKFRKTETIKTSNSFSKVSHKDSKYDFIEKKYEQYIKPKAEGRAKNESRLIKKTISNENQFSSVCKNKSMNEYKSQGLFVHSLSRNYSTFEAMHLP